MELTLRLLKDWVKQRETFENFTRDFPQANQKSQEHFRVSRGLTLLSQSEAIENSLRSAGLYMACGLFYSTVNHMPMLETDAEKLLTGHRIILADSLKGLAEFH